MAGNDRLSVLEVNLSDHDQPSPITLTSATFGSNSGYLTPI